MDRFDCYELCVQSPGHIVELGEDWIVLVVGRA